MLRSPRVFTLIELLVVVAVIAVLAGLLLPAAKSMTLKASVAETEKMVYRISVAQKAYKLEHGQFLAHWSATPSDYHWIDGNRGSNRRYDKQGRDIGSHNAERQTMVEVLNQYGSGIDLKRVKTVTIGSHSNVMALGDSWGNPLVCGILEGSSATTSWEGWSLKEWFVRGFQVGDFVVFSKGLVPNNDESRIFDPTNDTGVLANDSDVDAITVSPWVKIGDDAKRVYEPGVNRWANINE